MKCTKCGFENPEGMKFCGECGVRLENLCPICGFDNPPGFKFCGGCGASLIEATSTPINYTPSHLAQRILDEGEALEIRAGPDGERKTITALFADIKGSMDLLEELDPEEARNIVDPTLNLMMDAVHRYEGFVAQPTGDGIFALFGAPIAHEDHPQRALYAGLLMQEEIKKYAEKLRLEKGVNLEIRVGINTGDVVVRSIRKDDLNTDYVPVGHSTSLAARMESLATGGSVVVSENTHKLTEGFFQFKSMGKAQIKGVSEPLEIYEVQGVGALRTRLQVAVRRGLSRFVGRQGEMDGMKRSLQLAEEGKGQIVAVLGDPGVGKSRLFYEFRQVTGKGCLVLETFSISHGKAYPYLPLIDLLKNYFNLTPQDDERKRREKIGGKVLMLDRSLEDTLPYIFSLLGIEEEGDSLPQMDPQVKKKKTFEAIKRVLLRESLNQPLIIIFEDLHWMDGESQDFLNLLVESVATARLLLLVNYRPEYHHDWGSKTYYSQLRLDPLRREEAEELLTALVGEGEGAKHASPLQTLKSLILEKTEGNPFFMEEVVQTLAEEEVLSGDRGNYHLEKPPEELHIPTTVQGVLASRIDRLGSEEKEFLQTLSVIGKEFSFGLLKKVVDQQEEELQGLLYRLQEGEFIYEQPAFPEPDYTFKHALTQEVSYNSLLEERRSIVHEKTAVAIEEIYRYSLEEHYSDLAYHYSRSGNTEKAVEYLGLAGEQSIGRSAYEEGIDHLSKAIEFLKTLSDSLDRSRKELEYLVAIGPGLVATKGWRASETRETYERAKDLCDEVGDTPHLLPVLYKLIVSGLGEGEWHTKTQEFLQLAQESGDPAPLIMAHHVMGTTLLFGQGEFASALEHLEQGVALYDSGEYNSLSFIYGSEDPGVGCGDKGSHALWFLGYPDRAMKMIQEALDLAQELSYPFSSVVALFGASQLYRFRKDDTTARECDEAVVKLSSEHGYSFYLKHAKFQLNLHQIKEGKVDEVREQIQEYIDSFQSGVDQHYLSRSLYLLAEIYREVSKTEEGLKILTIVENIGLVSHEADINRLKGDLLRQKEMDSSQLAEIESEAEECFNKALEIARSQQAKSWELRAAMSMSRLWKEQGKKEEARNLLGDVYGWFTEGFDTKDLKEAKELLEELA